MIEVKGMVKFCGLCNSAIRVFIHSGKAAVLRFAFSIIVSTDKNPDYVLDGITREINKTLMLGLIFCMSGVIIFGMLIFLIVKLKKSK